MCCLIIKPVYIIAVFTYNCAHKISMNLSTHLYDFSVDLYVASLIIARHYYIFSVHPYGTSLQLPSNNNSSSVYFQHSPVWCPLQCPPNNSSSLYFQRSPVWCPLNLRKMMIIMVTLISSPPLL